MKIKIITALTAAAVLLVFSINKREYTANVNGAMNTVSHLTIISNINGKKILNECEKIIFMYDELFSVSNPKSDISKINQSDGFVDISNETFELMQKCNQFYDVTDGKFDITIGAVSELWSETFRTKSLPSDNEINAANATVNESSLEFNSDNNFSVKRTIAGQKINPGAAAKGYISDKLAEYLKEKKINSAMINLGGNVYACGTKKDGSPWRVGIASPDDTGVPAGIIKVRDKFVVTSGDYERYADIDGIRYHHIIDAKTAFPAQTGLKSVTIIADNGFIADGLSTSCFLLGLEEGIKLAKEYNVSAVFITDNFKIYYSSELEDVFEKSNKKFGYISF